MIVNLIRVYNHKTSMVQSNHAIQTTVHDFAFQCPDHHRSISEVSTPTGPHHPANALCTACRFSRGNKDSPCKYGHLSFARCHRTSRLFKRRGSGQPDGADRRLLDRSAACCMHCRIRREFCPKSRKTKNILHTLPALRAYRDACHLSGGGPLFEIQPFTLVECRHPSRNAALFDRRLHQTAGCGAPGRKLSSKNNPVAGLSSCIKAYKTRMVWS